MLRYPLTYFEIQKYFQNEPKFNGAYSRHNVPNIEDGAYVINLNVFKSIGTYQIALHENGSISIQIDGFGVTHTPKETKKFIRNKKIITCI